MRAYLHLIWDFLSDVTVPVLGISFASFFLGIFVALVSIKLLKRIGLF